MGGSERAPHQRGILFLIAHRNHYNCLLPVIQRLCESAEPVHCAIPGEAVLKDRLSAGQVARLRQLCGVTVMEKRLPEAMLARLAPQAFPRARRWAGRLARLLRSRGLRPTVMAIPLYLPNSRYLRRAVGNATRIVCIQHDPYHSAPPGASLGGYPVDLFCTWGEHTATFLREHGVEAEIRITGAPHLEKRPARPGVRAPEEPVRLLFATQPAQGWPPGTESLVTPRMKRRAIGDVLQALRELPQLRLTIKLHPVDDGGFERAALELATDVAARVELVAHQPGRSINDYIDSSDLVVTILSTVAFEGLVRGKPVMLLNYDNIFAAAAQRFGSERDYVAEGSALVAVDKPGLVSGLRDMLYDQATRGALDRARERFLAKHLRYDSRQAQQLICRILTES